MTPLRTGRIVYRPKCLRPGKTFCESEQCCEVSPKLGDLSLEATEPIKLRALRQGIVDLALGGDRGVVTVLDAPDRLACDPGSGSQLFA